MHDGRYEGPPSAGGGASLPGRSSSGAVASGDGVLSESEPGDAASGSAEGGCPVSGRHGEVLRAAQCAVAGLVELLESGPGVAGEVLDFAEQLGALVTQVQAAHTLAVGQAKASGMWTVDGYVSSAAWLRHTHLMDAGRARGLELTAV